MVKNKKAISPVVATALLLVVAVVAVVGFQTWFNTYQSGQLAEIESTASTGSPITLERLENDRVFLQNRGLDNFNLTVRVLGIDQEGVNCNSTGYPNTIELNGSSVQPIPLDSTNCPTGGRAEVIVVSEPAGVFTFTTLVRGGN